MKGLLHPLDEALSTYQTPPQSADRWRQKLSANDIWNRDGSARAGKLTVNGKFSH